MGKKLLIDYTKFDQDCEIKRYKITVAVDAEKYKKLKQSGASKSFQYLMEKYFSTSYLKKAVKFYKGKETDDENRPNYVTVSGVFTSKQYEAFNKVAGKSKIYKLNFAAKAILYYLFDSKVIGNEISIEENDKKNKSSDISKNVCQEIRSYNE